MTAVSRDVVTASSLATGPTSPKGPLLIATATTF